jgi:hypothetical protein
MAYGSGGKHGMMIGEVVNIDSPYQDGSCQVRIHGLEDDKQKIPDDKLRWHKTMMPVTHGQTPGSGGSHGLQKGSKVICVFFDQGDQQIPVIIGSLTSTGKIGK